MLFLRWYLWVVPHLLCGACFICLLRRTRLRSVSLFLYYLAIQIVGFLCLLVTTLLILRFPSLLSLYGQLNIADTAASATATLVVIYALTDELVFSRLSLRDLTHTLMRCALAVLLLIAAAASALLHNAGLQNIMRVFQTVDFAGSVLVLGLVLTVVMLTRVLYISWRNLPAGILVGFGIYASVEFSAAPLLSVFGHGKSLIVLDVVRMGAFHVCTLVWLVYAFLPERSPNLGGTELARRDLKLWAEELESMVGR